MKNRDKYKVELDELYSNKIEFAIRDESGDICDCRDIGCRDCLFAGYSFCDDGREDWLETDTDLRQFTKPERKLIELLNGVKYLARDENGDLCGFVNKPEKDTKKFNSWSASGEWIFLSPFTKYDFKNIRWEDKEPTSREEILGD